MKYANIIVNISHESLDRSFQYIIPKELEEQLSLGDYVSVPFGKGNRVINGYVVEITDKAMFDVTRMKEIIEIVTDSRLVEKRMIQLAGWMRHTYGSTMINALKTVLPIKKNIKEKQERSIVLSLDEEEAADRLLLYIKKHQTARERLLKELIEEKNLDYSLVTSKLNVSKATIDAMVKQEVVKVVSQRVYRNSAEYDYEGTKVPLNEEQRKVCDAIINEYDNGIRSTYLLRGVTGSGKTEVYMEVIDHVVSCGKQAIVLIPEIALTFQTCMRFYKRYGSRVSTIHSKLSDGEKYDQFERAKKGEISIMIGPRSALFTPFSNLGLVVIDEEHEGSYKSDNVPKYHARETAEELCRLHNATLLLGSATPSLDSYYRALKGEYKLFTLNQRAKEAILPSVKVIDLKEEFKSGNKTMFSGKLVELIEDRLLKNEQVMLFLNRRGYVSSLSCRSCGHVVKCPHCDVSLTLHANDKLVCHYCGYETANIKQCPECGSKYIGGMKAGTEQIEQQIKLKFPMARVLRMDADTTKKKDDYEAILSAFANREGDILIGTQMIVKGHDFPYVTLMGVLIADMSLNSGDYRASERTFQLLTQAAGRAGRGNIKGDVVIQTYQPEHYSILSAASQNYEKFYDEEIVYRQLMKYPPVGHMLLVLIEGENEKMVENHTDGLAKLIKDDIIKKCMPKKIAVIGPADASVKKINDVFRKVIYLKSEDEQLLLGYKDYIEEYHEINRIRGVFMQMDYDPVRGY